MYTSSEINFNPLIKYIIIFVLSFMYLNSIDTPYEKILPITLFIIVLTITIDIFMFNNFIDVIMMRDMYAEDDIENVVE